MSEIPSEFRTYSLDEVAELLFHSGRTVSVRTLQEYCRKGQIRGVKVGANWRVSHESLRAWLNGEAAGPVGAAPVMTTPVAETRGKDPIQDPEPPRPARPGRRLGGNGFEAAAPALKAALGEWIEKRPEVDEAPALPRMVAAPVPAPEVPIEPEVRTLADLLGDGDEDLDAAVPGVTIPVVESPAAKAPPVETVTRPAAGAAAEPTLPLEHDLRLFHADGSKRLFIARRRGADGRLVRHGRLEAWHENGAPAARGQYVDGRLSGPWKQWHPNGQLRVVGNHRDGLQDGVWTWWDESGRKVQEGPLLHGRPQGAWTGFHITGQVWYEGRYQDGRPEGAWRFFEPDGKLAPSGSTRP